MSTTSPTSVYPMFYVRSDRTPSLYYLVAPVDDLCACGSKLRGLWHCSCPDHINRDRDCKHIKRVFAGTVAPATRKVA